MSEQDQREQDQSEQDQREQDAVEGVDTNPDGGNKSITVDTNERLEQKDRHLDDVPEDELKQEREERLDPDKRPENVEVDNSDRNFNPETGLFDDSDVDPPEGAPFATTEAEESKTKEPQDREEATDADQSKESKESKDTES